MTEHSSGQSRTAARGEDEDRAHLLLELAARVTGTLDLQEVLDASFVALRRLLDFGGGAIQLIEDDHLVAAATDPPMAPEAATVRIPVGQGVSGTIAQTGETIYIPDIAVDERVHPEGRKKGVSAGVHSYFGIPLILGGGPIGVIQVDAPEIDAFDSESRALVLAFVPTIAAAVQNARLFEQEREAIRRLEETDRLKNNFVSIVSHELRTPMVTVNGFAQTLANHVAELPEDQIVDLAHRIQGAGQRLHRLLEDLLYVSRLEQGFLQVRIAPTDVAEVADAVAAEDARLSNDVELDLEDDLPLVDADADRLHQVLTNLVDNAVKYSPRDETVWLRARRVEGGVEIAVEDRGRGIPLARKAQIFDLFVQGEDADTRSAGGLGIGLYVVKRLTDAMDAELRVADRPGGGTRIAIRLTASGGDGAHRARGA